MFLKFTHQGVIYNMIVRYDTVNQEEKVKFKTEKFYFRCTFSQEN